MEALLAAVDDLRDDLVELLQALIRLPTVNPPGEGYEAFVAAFARRLDALGYATEVHRVPEADLATLNAIFTAQEETIVRPSREITATLRTAPEFVDALPVFAEVTSPFLIVLATRNLPVPPDLVGLMDAHRAGLRRDLAELTARRPNLHVHELDASHAMVVERPTDLATIINDFIPR